MRVITKKVFITFLGLFLGFAVVSCGSTTTTVTTTTTSTPNDAPIPELSNPDSVFYSTDKISLTYGDVYETLKINDGISQLLNMVDEQLLSTYITSVTDAQIANKIKKLTYGTTDDSEIAKLSAADKATKEKAYDNSMILLGFQNNPEEYIRFIVAKENYVKALMVNPDNSDQSWYVGPTAIANYYMSKYDNAISSIKIAFSSEAEATNTMRANNLVPVGGILKLYTGTTPLDQVPTSALNDSNTRTLTNLELIAKFVDMFNQIYGGYKAPISDTSSVSELIANPELQVSYDDVNTYNASLAALMFTGFGNYTDYTSGTDTTAFYTYKPISFDSSINTNYFIILNLAGNNKADVSGFSGTKADLISKIGECTYDTIKATIIDNNLNTSSFVTTRLAELRSDHGFKIFDYYLGLDYQQMYAGYVQGSDGDTTNVATFDDTQITADQLLKFALDRNAPLYLMYASQIPSLLAYHYTDVFCTDSTQACDYDFINNTSSTMQTALSAYANLVTSFQNSQYANYYTLPEYIYLAYGAKDEQDMLERYYVKSSLQPLMIYDNLIANDDAMIKALQPYIDDYYSHYFSLNATKLLVYLDRNEDGVADDYQTFYDSLTDTTAFDTLIADFKTAVSDYINADSANTFGTLVKDYNKATMDDPIWGAFKQFGIHIKSDKVSTSGSSTYANTVNNYSAEVVTELENLYNTYSETANVDKAFMLSSDYVQTTDGLNLFYATKGSAFEKPSFQFTMTFAGNGDPNFTVGLENSQDTYTWEQLQLYSEYRFAVMGVGIVDTEAIYGFTKPTIPDSLLTAFDTYFQEIYNAMYVVGYMNIIMCDQLGSGTFDNTVPSYTTITETRIKSELSSIHQIYSDNILKNYNHLDK